MTAHLPQLLFGLLLLWFPRQWMRFGITLGRRRRRLSTAVGGEEPWTRRESGDPRISFRREFAKFRNYFDFLRAAAGALAIVGAGAVPASIQLAEGAEGAAGWQVLVIKLGILFVGLTVQTLRYERNHLSFFAPIFFLAGLSLSLCTLWGAVFAFTIVWAMNPLVGNSQVFLVLYGLAMALFGMLFHGFLSLLPIIAFFLCFFPVLVSLLAGRPLVVFSRKAAHPTGG